MLSVVYGSLYILYGGIDNYIGGIIIVLKSPLFIL